MKNIQTTQFLQDFWNLNFILGFVSAHTQRNTISNLQLHCSYNALRSKLLRPSTSCLTNLRWREYTPRVDSIKMQMPSMKNINLALDGWTSMNNLAITSFIAYYMDCHWVLPKLTLTIIKVDNLFFSYCKWEVIMMGPELTYWTKAGMTLKGNSRSVWAS